MVCWTAETSIGGDAAEGSRSLFARVSAHCRRGKALGRVGLGGTLFGRDPYAVVDIAIPSVSGEVSVRLVERLALRLLLD